MDGVEEAASTMDCTCSKACLLNNVFHKVVNVVHDCNNGVLDLVWQWSKSRVASMEEP